MSEDIELAGERITNAVSKFCFNGAGPSHRTISVVLVGAGLGDDFKYNPEGGGPTKQQRIESAFARSRRRPGSSKMLLEGLLGLFANDALLESAGNESEDFQSLKKALAARRFFVDDQLKIRRFGAVDLESGGRPALDQQLARMRRADGDTALLLGTSKEVLESTAKLVLEQVQGLDREVLNKMNFPQIWALSRECLGVMPKQVDVNQPNHATIRKLYQAIWQIAEQVNELRNDQGTGHGDTLPIGISEALAKLIVREVCVVSEFMLDAADRLSGRPV
jgi:hypothetical protein